MLPGPDIVIACPKCDALAKVFSLTSGNTFGATIWSDGKVDAPMLPRPPAITKCHKCNSFYWVDDAKKVGEHSFWQSNDADVDPAWEDAPHIRELTEVEYYHAIDSGLGGTPEKEKHLRLISWWCSNDRYRNSSTSGDPPRDNRCLENMRRLFELLDADDVNGRITKAEVARELGNFTEAINLVTTIDDKATKYAKSFLLALCHEETTAVKVIHDPHHPQRESRRLTLSIFNPPKPAPCPYCGEPLRTAIARQCPHCKMDWHDPENIHRRPDNRG